MSAWQLSGTQNHQGDKLGLCFYFCLNNPNYYIGQLIWIYLLDLSRVRRSSVLSLMALLIGLFDRPILQEINNIYFDKVLFGRVSADLVW